MAKRPNIDRFKSQQESRTERFVETKVRPYLQTLLDQAQRKLTRHRVTFLQGMGVSQFDLDPPGPRASGWDLLNDSLTTAAQTADRGGYWQNGRKAMTQADDRRAARFPELVEFLMIVDKIEDELGYCVGEMAPTD